ncbi:MAG TPA: hypothetical protein VJR29_05700 [bacterium]|nr:hypothetical protein [bacterium]
MAAFEFAGDPGLILLLPKGARWEGNKIEFRDAEFYRPFLKETLDHYDAVAHLTYRDRPLAPRIEGLLSDGKGNLAGFLMEKVAGKNLYDLVQDGEISPEQMKRVEALLREQLSILHRNGLAHGDPEFLNVLVQLGANGEVIDARFIDFTRPKSDKYEPTHGTPQYDLDVMAEELKHYWEKAGHKKIPVVKDPFFYLLEESRAMNRHGLLPISQWYNQAEAGDLAAAERLRTFSMEPFKKYLQDPSLDRHEQDASLQLLYLIRHGNLPAFELLVETARTHSQHLLTLAGELAPESPVALLLRGMPIEVHLADTDNPIRIVSKNAKLALETLAEFGNADAAAALRELKAKDSKLAVDDRVLLAGQLENGRPVHLYQVDGGHAAIKGLFSWIVVAFGADRLVLQKVDEWAKENPDAKEEIFFQKEGRFDSSFLRKIFQILPRVGGGHDGPLKPKVEEVAKFVDLYESGDEVAGLRGLVELAEQGLAQAVLEMLVLKLGPGTGDRLKIQEALASVRPAALADRAPEEYPALRALLELAASGNEAAQSTLATVSLAALRKALALPPEAEGPSSSFNLDLADCLFYGNPEAEEILFGEHRHQIHPEHLAQWEEKILREGRLNYSKLSPERLLELAREGRKDILFGLLEMGKERSNPTIRGLLDFLFYEETAGVLIERIRWLRGEMGPTTLLEHDLQSTPADHVRRIAQFAPHRADAQRALLELANAGHPEARRALSAPPLNGTFEDGQEMTLFLAESAAQGLTAWKYLGLHGMRPAFEKVRMHEAEPYATLRLLGIEGSPTRLKPGAHYYFLEKNDADPTEPRGDPSPFSLPFMIFGPDSLLRRGLDWLWQKIGGPEKPEAADRFATLESSPAEGWALDEAGQHYFDHPRRLQLTDQPSEFAEKKYGRWRLLDLQVWRGRSVLLLEKRGPVPERLYFETSEPLRRAIREDGQIYLIGKETLLPVDADLYFFPVISGGSDGSGFAFGRLGSAAARGLLLKDFSGWKGRFRLYQIERREADGLGQVWVLKSADGGGTEELRFQVEAGDAGQAHTGWKTGDYLYFIADSAKGLSAHPEDRPPGESFSEIYRNWRNSPAAESRRRIAQRMFAAKPPEVPTNSHIPKPTVLRETGGGEFLLKTRRVDEAEYDVRYSAILIGHEVEAGDPYREAAQVRLSFGLFETIEDFRHFKEHGFPRRSFTFLATRAEATRLGFEYDAAGNLLSQSREKNWILKESGRPAALRGEWQVSPSVPEPQPPPLPAEYRLFDSGAAEGSAVMVGRGAAPAGFESAFLSIEDPVVRRRHLLIRRGAENKVEIQAIPPDRRPSEGRNRQAFWVESGEDWLPLPANLPYILKPGERFALGQVNRQGQTSQALVFRLSADGNSLILD